MFEEIGEIEELKMQMSAIKESSDKVRRGIFVRHNELSRMYLELMRRMDMIERGICNGKES
jgi:hypothetical protein